MQKGLRAFSRILSASGASAACGGLRLADLPPDITEVVKNLKNIYILAERQRVADFRGHIGSQSSIKSII